MSPIRAAKKTYDEALVEIINEYREIHGPDACTMRDVAAWALGTGRWQRQKRSAIKELTRHLSAAARKSKVTDPQGRTVRAMHAARVPRAVDENGNLMFEVVWDYINTMSRDHAEMSFQQRREKLAEGCRSLKTDIDSFNENNPNAGDGKIQKSFDFTFDVKPIEAQVTDSVRSPSSRKPR